MEAYAQALVCRAKNTPFIAVKYVTDIIGQNSVKHWEDKLADARKGLGEFLGSIWEEWFSVYFVIARLRLISAF